MGLIKAAQVLMAGTRTLDLTGSQPMTVQQEDLLAVGRILSARSSGRLVMLSERRAHRQPRHPRGGARRG